MANTAAYIGTSGWSYPHWAKGVFYPRGLKQGEWLRFYAEHFDTVEVNMTFYRLPRKELLERWVSATPNRFQFLIKLSHREDLLNSRDRMTAAIPYQRSESTVRRPVRSPLPHRLDPYFSARVR